MKKRILTVVCLILVALVIVSCELTFSSEKPDIYLISWGNDYAGGVALGGYIDENGYPYIGRYYDHDLYVTAGSLNKTVNDANDVSNAFEVLSFRAGYNFINYNLIGYENCDIDSFLYALADVKSKIKDKDILICYFSGHGDGFSSSQGDKYFMAFSNCLVNYEFIKKCVDSVSKGQKVIICDTCRSGAMIPVENGVVVNPDTSGADSLSMLFGTSVNESGTLFIMTACTMNQLSYEGARNGVFTASLLKGLGWNGAENTLGDIKALKNNKLSVAGLAKFIYSNDKNEDYANTQIPVFSGRSDDIILFSF